MGAHTSALLGSVATCGLAGFGVYLHDERLVRPRRPRGPASRVRRSTRNLLTSRLSH